MIGRALDSLRRLRSDFEVIIVDGGSRDRTRELVSCRAREIDGLLLICCEPGRGVQLNAGAGAARGDVLVFLHADTLLPEDAMQSIEAAVRDPEAVGGNFRMAFAGEGFSSKLFTLLDRVRRWFGIYYGDSVIWVRREIFEDLKGFIAAPIMEDYDFCRKLERAGRTLCLPGPALSSPRRWSRGRALSAIVVWTLIQWLYLIGVSPHRLAWLYYPKTFKLRRKPAGQTE